MQRRLGLQRWKLTKTRSLGALPRSLMIAGTVIGKPYQMMLTLAPALACLRRLALTVGVQTVNSRVRFLPRLRVSRSRRAAVVHLGDARVARTDRPVQNGPGSMWPALEMVGMLIAQQMGMASGHGCA